MSLYDYDEFSGLKKLPILVVSIENRKTNSILDG